MSELLLELLSEEIPARMQQKAATSLLEQITGKLNDLSITYSDSFKFSTPRRISVVISGLPVKTQAKMIERKGPKTDARSEAIEGFLKSTGLALSELKVVDGFYYALKQEESKEISTVLKDILEQILISFTWPKSMRLSGSRIRWVRPLRNILCIFSGQIIPVNFGDLIANNYTYGHRFLAPDKITIFSSKEYQEKLESAFVILSPEKREKLILEQISLTGLINAENIDKNLLQEVVGLVEFPNSLCGSIQKRFLKLPKEVLITSMKTHQRYFHAENSEGSLLPYFITVANIKNDHDDLIISGNEKVLTARLSDAEFFYQADLKTPISESLTKLTKLIFHSKLGNMFDKTNRIIELAEYINQDIQPIEKVKKAALLCKTDLVSEMVGEFPELQGIMGKYYAIESGIESEVAEAIEQHYRPQDSQDIGNISSLGAIISIADKIDSIVGLWFAGEKPTSSKDPFALRRAALGIIKLIRFHDFNLSISELIDKTVKCYDFENNPTLTSEIIEFFNDRLKFYLKSENYRHDFINAVLNYHSDNIANTSKNIQALDKFSHEKDLFLMLKRINNLTKDSTTLGEINSSLFEEVEANLYRAIASAHPTLDALKELVPYTNEFFEKIMVNSENEQVKNNRLLLLKDILKLSDKIANFNLVEI